MTPFFYNKDFSLTTYSLACGYQEKWEDEYARIYMYREPATNVYHVRGFDNQSNQRMIWESYDNVSGARRFFYQKIYFHFGLSRRKYLAAVAVKEKRSLSSQG